MKIFSYDIESTTGGHNDGSMCTFGYCLIDENMRIIQQKDIVMRPYTNRFESKIKLHYEKQVIKNSPRFPNFYDEIVNFFKEDRLIIGFSVLNDVEFLNSACDIYKLKRINYSFLDVQLLYKTVYNKPSLTSLEKIAEELQIEYLAHRSDEDARVTFLVLKHIVDDLNLTVDQIIKKFNITLGENYNGEVENCTNGILTKREKNYLILKFVEENHKHSRRYKGGFSFKTFAFDEKLRYDDIDKFRRIIKRIYDLNGRIGAIESSNVFVNPYGERIPEKYAHAIAIRNTGKQRIKIISQEEFFNMLGELPEIDFSSDSQTLKVHRKEIKLERMKRRQELKEAKKTDAVNSSEKKQEEKGENLTYQKSKSKQKKPTKQNKKGN